MKNTILIITLLISVIVSGQAFNGKGDQKFQIGANLQNNVNGIYVSYDRGIGENISIGVTSTYILHLNNGLTAEFEDRFDIKARFNANIGSVLNIDNNFDIYPGLSLSLKNLGGHLGMRYFFSSGFGIFTELGTTLAKYNSKALNPSEKIHNQFAANFGAVFNL